MHWRFTNVYCNVTLDFLYVSSCVKAWLTFHMPLACGSFFYGATASLRRTILGRLDNRSKSGKYFLRFTKYILWFVWSIVLSVLQQALFRSYKLYKNYYFIYCCTMTTERHLNHLLSRVFIILAVKL
jgi:hypothetical protein